MRLRCQILSSLMIGIVIVPAAWSSTPTYAVLRKIAIGGEGGWDYLTADSDAHRLYISRGTHVQVLDTKTEKLIGDIPNTPGVHGIALNKKLGLGYTSNGRENSVTVFDLSSLKEVARVKVDGRNPDAILFDKATNRIFTFNGQSKDVTAIDAATNTVVGTIKVNGKPEFPQADGKGTIFVNIEDTSEVQQIDAKKLTVTRTWKIAPAEGPSGMAIDTKGHRIFSVCDGAMAISDTASGKLVQTAKIGDGPDAAAFDSTYGVALSSNGGDGTLSVVAKSKDGSYQTVQTVTTQKGARTMAIDPKSHLIYLIDAEFGQAAPGARRAPMKPNSAFLIVVGPK